MSFILAQVDRESLPSDYGTSQTTDLVHQTRRRIPPLPYRTLARYTTGVLTTDAALSPNRREYS